MGNVNNYLYAEGYNGGAPHEPFYDVTSGCNNQTTSLRSTDCGAIARPQDTVWRPAGDQQTVRATGAGQLTGTMYGIDHTEGVDYRTSNEHMVQHRAGDELDRVSAGAECVSL